MSALVEPYRRLSTAVDLQQFKPPVTHVYNPLSYAQQAFEHYLALAGDAPGRVVLLGMNPGPFGMAQCGVPFGEVRLAHDWLGVRGRIDRPKPEHPKRPVDGFACSRSEVSGARLWGWAKQRYQTPQRFFREFIVLNYCPLAFLESSGRNRTPDKLPSDERGPLLEGCDESLREIVAVLKPRAVVGIGAFAETRARNALPDEVVVGRILHPSPASPIANRGWAPQAEAQLAALANACA